MENIDAAVAKSTSALEELQSLVDLASPSPDVKGSAKEYLPIMHFVDQKYDELPSTCGGDLVNDPIVNETPDGCASACNANFQKCVGFAYFADEKLCFLFSSFKSQHSCKHLTQTSAQRKRVTLAPAMATSTMA